jgi:hypothetical protein
MKAPRPVRIQEFRGTIWVLYMDRKKGIWNSAAQFDSRIKTVEEVVKWVKENPKLKLYDHPGDPPGL